MRAGVLFRLLRRPPRVVDLRAAFWGWRALRSVRTQLRGGTVRGVRAPVPPPLPLAAFRAVRVVLTGARASCLEGALVLQSWLAAHGVERDVIVGTRGGANGDFSAHAWVDGTPQGPEPRFAEMIRLAP